MPDETQDPMIHDQVLTWMNQNNYTRASFDRIISHVQGASTYSQLRAMAQQREDIFRPIVIRGGLEGIALIGRPMPRGNISPPTQEVLQSDDLAEVPVVDQPKVTAVEHMEELIARSADADTGSAALNFAQAALCVAQSIGIISNIKNT